MGSGEGQTICQRSRGDRELSPVHLARNLPRSLWYLLLDLASTLQPDRIGPRQDALATILAPSLFLLLLHGAIWVYSRTEGDRAFRWRLYLESNQFLVGTLLYMWIVGFNIVSWVIYRQFERNEPYPADDYYVASLDETGRGAGLAPLVLNLPDKRLALAQQ